MYIWETETERVECISKCKCTTVLRYEGSSSIWPGFFFEGSLPGFFITNYIWSLFQSRIVIKKLVFVWIWVSRFISYLCICLGIKKLGFCFCLKLGYLGFVIKIWVWRLYLGLNLTWVWIWDCHGLKIWDLTVCKIWVQYGLYFWNLGFRFKVWNLENPDYYSKSRNLGRKFITHQTLNLGFWVSSYKSWNLSFQLNLEFSG